MFYAEVENKPDFNLVMDKSSANNGRVNVDININEIICRVIISSDEHRFVMLLDEGDIDKLRDVLYDASREMALNRANIVKGMM